MRIRWWLVFVLVGVLLAVVALTLLSGMSQFLVFCVGVLFTVLVAPFANTTTFERPPAALGCVLARLCGRATPRSLRPCQASTGDHSRCRRTYESDHLALYRRLGGTDYHREPPVPPGAPGPLYVKQAGTRSPV